jgi:type I restriction enzyme S subunit
MKFEMISESVLSLEERGVLKVEDGNHGEYRPRKNEFVDQGVSFIRAADIKDGIVMFDDAEGINETALSRIRKGIGRPGDVLITHKGTIGRVGLVADDAPDFVCSPQTTFWRVLDPTFADRYYLYAYMRSPQFQELFRVYGGETDMAPYVSLTSQRSLVLSLPNIATQRAIGKIIQCLDRKIDLNRKTNKTLERIAKAMFKSWFMDFDPVWAKAEGQPTGLPDEISELFPDSFEDTELGGIPAGWRIGEVQDLCEWVSSGGTPARSHKEFWEEGDIPWFKTGELNDGPLLDSSEKINELAINNSACKLWDRGTILFAIYASPTVGRLGVLTSRGTSNQAAAGLMASKGIGIPFLRRCLLFSRDDLQNIAVGAAQQNINVKVLKEHRVVIPPETLANKFSSLVADLDDRQEVLLREVAILEELRDALLPKLISGELRVPDAEKMLEEVGI